MLISRVYIQVSRRGVKRSVGCCSLAPPGKQIAFFRVQLECQYGCFCNLGCPFGGRPSHNSSVVFWLYNLHMDLRVEALYSEDIKVHTGT